MTTLRKEVNTTNLGPALVKTTTSEMLERKYSKMERRLIREGLSMTEVCLHPRSRYLLGGAEPHPPRWIKKTRPLLSHLQTFRFLALTSRGSATPRPRDSSLRNQPHISMLRQTSKGIRISGKCLKTTMTTIQQTKSQGKCSLLTTKFMAARTHRSTARVILATFQSSQTTTRSVW